MKTFSAKAALALVALAFSIIFAGTASAQSGMANENWKDIKVGPMFTIGGAVNAGSVATGWKTSPGLAYSFGARGILPFSSNISFDMGLCYDARSINFHSENSTDTGWDYTFSYLALRPGFNLGGFTIGLGIGIPVGVSGTYKPGSIVVSGLSTSDANLLLEGRIGGEIEVSHTDKTDLRFLIEGTYGFTQIMKNSSGSDNTKNNGPFASLELGFAYLFDLSPH